VRKGKDHWHWVPGGEKEKPHYSPGYRIKAFIEGHREAIIGAAIVGGAILLAPEAGGTSLIFVAAP
jgi:hypothetical protein